MKKKPRLVIVSEKTRDHFHRPLRYFQKLTIVHLYSAKYPDSTIDVPGVEAIIYRTPFELIKLLKDLQPDYLQGLEPYYGYSRFRIPFKVFWRLLVIRWYVWRDRPIFFFHVLENIRPQQKYGYMVGILMQWLFRWYAKPARFIFYANEGAKENCLAVAIEEWKLKKSKWGFWGVDTQLFKTSLKTKEPSLLFLGSLNEQKGIKDFLAIAEKIGRTHRNLVVTIIGDGSERSYVQNAIASNKNKNWQWIPIVKYSQLPKMIARHWLMVSPRNDLPWSREQVGMANLETLACGVPVVGYDSGSSREFSPPSEAIKLVKSGDHQNLVETIERYLANQALCDKASRQAREWVEKHFVDHQSVKELEQWIRPDRPGIIFAKATHSIGGGELQTLALGRGLARQLPIAFIMNRDSPLRGRIKNYELRIKEITINLGPEAVNRWPIIQLFFYLPRLRRQAKHFLHKLYLDGNRIIVCQSINEKLVFSSAAKQLGMMVVWLDLQSLKPWIPKNPLFGLLKGVVEDVGWIVTSSKFLARELAQLYGRPVDVVYPGIEVKRIKHHESRFVVGRARMMNQEKIIVGTVGRLHEEKGLDVFLRALALLPANYYGSIVGDGSARGELKGLVAKLNLQSRVKLVGFQKEMGRFYEQFDLFCQPSRRDNTPLAIIEAMSYGLPIVTTNIGGIPEVVEDAGVMVDGDNPKQLAEMIQKIVTDRELYRSLSLRALNQSRKFSLDKMAKSFWEVISRP